MRFLRRYLAKLGRIVAAIVVAAAFVGAVGYYLVPEIEELSQEATLPGPPEYYYGLLSNASIMAKLRPSVVRVVSHGNQPNGAIWTEFSRSGDVTTFVTEENEVGRKLVAKSLMPNRIWKGRRTFVFRPVTVDGKPHTKLEIREENRILNPYLRLARYLSVDREAPIRHTLQVLAISSPRS